MLQYLLRSGLVGRVLSYIGPHDLSVGTDDEDRWRHGIVRCQAVHSVLLDHPVIDVGKDWKRGIHGPRDALRHIQGTGRHHDDLGTARTKILIGIMQLDELPPVGPSTTALDEDQDHWTFSKLVR